MKEKILIRSVLEGYRFMDKIINRLDANVLSKGVNSFNTQGVYETLNLANNILGLAERKRKLLVVKSLIEECVKSMNAQSAKLIMLKFVDGFTNTKLSKMFGFGLKKIARLLDKAVGDVALFFYAKGFNCLNLLEYLKEEDWLIGIYHNHLKYANKFSCKHTVAYI